MVKVEDFHNDLENKWCPGCGNFGILDALKNALAAQNIAPHQLLMISGIGQAAKTPQFLKCNFFHTLHGRSLPIATGAKMANHDLTIVVNGGDGDIYGEGGNHFMNVIRRNVDITLLVHNNGVYGLTKGQASPTAEMGFVTSIQADGVIAEPFHPLTMALELGAGFVGRAFSNDRKHLGRIIQDAMQYKGFSMIDILQPCVAYNRVNTHGFYKKRVYDLYEEPHDPGDFDAAVRLAKKWGDRIPIGILYKKEKPDFVSKIKNLDKEPLIAARYDANRIRQAIEAL
ncbi:MAG: thiamine pyrophosphate-dependent enzyme [Proteobacteria bacterium]|nr:thiamine pyrophosphate-dependent enzyme [Pseudomonadota bacterium]